MAGFKKNTSATGKLSTPARLQKLPQVNNRNDFPELSSTMATVPASKHKMTPNTSSAWSVSRQTKSHASVQSSSPAPNTSPEEEHGNKAEDSWAAIVDPSNGPIGKGKGPTEQCFPTSPEERGMELLFQVQRQEQRIAADEKMAELQRYLLPKTQLSVLRFCLGLETFEDAPPLAKEIVVICFDTEGWTADSNKICEVGMNTFAVSAMQEIEDIGPHGENLMRRLFFYHIRVRENAHLINIGNCPGNPEANRYGQTRFCDLKDMRDVLDAFFGQETDMTNPGLGYRPLIILGHALGSDLIKLRTTMGWDPYVFGNIVKEVDTQQLARDCGLWCTKNDQIGLHKLTIICHVAYRDGHTANNDAAMTTFDAFQLAIYGIDVIREDDRVEAGKTLQDVIDEVEKLSLEDECDYGSEMCCLRCGSLDHMENKGLRSRCRVKVECAHCIENPKTHGKAFSHMTERCIMYALANGNSSRKKENSPKTRKNWNPTPKKPQSNTTQGDTDAKSRTYDNGSRGPKEGEAGPVSW
jgi:hypothetical protein